MVLSMERWKGKIAVVTGASDGIGEKIVEQLVAAGVKVAGLARRIDKMQETSIKLNVNQCLFYPIKCDLSIEEDIVTTFQTIKENIGSVSILINCAGVIGCTNLVEGDTAIWKKIFDVNVIGLCITTREAVKSMRENDIQGHIVHINSIAGHKIPYFSESNVYPASKYAVTALTETLRLELNTLKSKIKISSVSPGLVDTNIITNADFPKDHSEYHLIKTDPVLHPEDVAEAVLYVLSTPPHVQIHELIIKPLNEEY